MKAAPNQLTKEFPCGYWTALVLGAVALVRTSVYAQAGGGTKRAKIPSLAAVFTALIGSLVASGAESPQDFAATADLHWAKLRVAWPNRSNEVYLIQKQSAPGEPWKDLVYVSGDAPRLTYQDEQETAPSQFYRIALATTNAPARIASLQKTLDQQRRACTSKGACAVVVTKDWTWVGTSGMSDPDMTNAIQPNMRFSYASCTKMFTAALILRLQEEGELSINDTLQQWLPEIPQVTNSITIKQLLNHTAGLYDWFWDSKLWPFVYKEDLSRFWTPGDTLAINKRPVFKPGGGFNYSSMGYILLGMVAEAAAGEPVQQAWRRRFMSPLNLPSLWLRPQEPPTGELAHGFSAYFTPKPEDVTPLPDTAIYSSFWTAGAIMGSPLDMARWTRALYNGEILNATSMKQMTNLVDATNIGGRYGLGTLEQSTSKGPFLGHGGDGFGFRCMMGHSPKLNATVLFVINTEFGWEPTAWERMMSAWQALITRL